MSGCKIISALILLVAIAHAYVFVSRNVVSHRVPVSATRLTMGGAKGISSTRDGKEVTISSLQEQLVGCEMLFSIPSSSIKVNQITSMRKQLPEGTVARVVKNKLMRIAVKGTEWELVSDHMTKGENMWFFVQDDLSTSIKVAKDFAKDINKLDTHLPKYGVIEGISLDAAGVEKISQLPTKMELYRRIAVAIKLVPTKIARGINLVPTKVGRSIKLAFAEEKTEEEVAPADEEAVSE